MSVRDVVTQQRPVFLASIKLYLLNWSRSRAPLGMLAFVAVLCWYDAVAPNRSPSPWSLLTFAGAWSGFLAACDTYERLRADGSLRLILLHGQSRATFAIGMAAGGILVSVVGTAVTLAYLIVAGRLIVSSHLLIVLPVTLLAVAGWVVYAQLLSLLVPRDTAAILGIIALVFGSGPPERWLPLETPAVVQQAAMLVWSAMPTTVRFTNVLNGDGTLENVAMQLGQLVVALAVVCALLMRRRLLSRQRVEG